ncbi:MAG TPA: methyltransferase domain-containing protein [bacterium]|nr:methyltransferase domain-containing protein [bacterium]
MNVRRQHDLDSDSPQRLALVPPLKVVEVLRPRPGQRFLDVACGTGTFFFPVFESMLGKGVFLAAEWDEERLRRFLTRLESYVEHPGYTRMEVVRTKPERLPLPDRCADLVLMAQAYHNLADRAAYLLELKRLLAPGGTLCLLDWHPAAEDPASAGKKTLGPDHSARVSEQQAVRDLSAAGFRWLVAHAGFAQHWCLTGRV